jgi:hypothetical protein
MAGRSDSFGFVQLEFGFLLGPPDGRYLVRSAPDAELEAVLVLSTLGAPERRRLAGRRARPVEAAEPEPVPTGRATVVRPEPFRSRAEAGAWLAGLARDADAAAAEVDAALGVLNRALRAQRLAAADPYLAELSPARALVARVGYGSGQAAAEGRFAEALELPRAGARRVKRSMGSPEERFAALLGGRERPPVAEELVLRARADLDAGRLGEAALQARIAFEALLAELPDAPAELAARRTALTEAANAALGGAPGGGHQRELTGAVEAMEAAVRRRSLRGVRPEDGA